MNTDGYFCPNCHKFKALHEVTISGDCKICGTQCSHPMDTKASDDYHCSDDFFNEEEDENE